ncbi:MAG: hypothetical protein RIA09_16045 [Hoeflea sp.]|jgi:hypothetical protein|uniref:hypothetical protein n=1 Tax=Hoeflea sp. TaxID=1940281 RepID=UPI0032F022C6
MTTQIRFSSGHCFQRAYLSKPEVEILGPLLHDHLDQAAKTLDQADFSHLERRVIGILAKLDYPAWEKKHD